MLVFLINTFNRPSYLDHARDCLNAVRERMRDSAVNIYAVVVCGGCPTNTIFSEEGASYINIEENLSDHNAHVGFDRFLEHFRSEEFLKATYVYMHDTCRPTSCFRQRMEELDGFSFRSRDAEWVFASTYGLFNIGICNYAFVSRRAKDFEGITFVSKEEDLDIERGVSVRIQDKTVPALRSYSIYTLSAMYKEYAADMDLSSVDMYGINGIRMHDRVRWVSYLASLGIHKFYSGKFTYPLPIYCHPDNHPHSEEAFDVMKRFAKEYMNTSFVPMISYSEKN